MSKLRSLGFALVVLACGACGDAMVAPDAGLSDVTTLICGCAHPADCAGGVCCVAFDRTSSGPVVRSQCMTQLDCVRYKTLMTTQTIACDHDGDCASESADGGTGTCAAPTQRGSCGSKVCH